MFQKIDGFDLKFRCECEEIDDDFDVMFKLMCFVMCIGLEDFGVIVIVEIDIEFD